MTIRQSAKLRMYLAVVALCARVEYAGAVGLIPAFAAALKSFLEMQERIKTARKEQKTSTKGITESKSEARVEMTKLGNRIGAALTTYADAVGDIELRGEAGDAAIPLDRGTETEAAARAEVLEELAAKYDSILVKEYGLKATDLEAFGGHITAFSKAIGRPRNTIAKRRAATESIPDLFVEADAYLDRMDRLTLNLEPEHPKFVAAYNAARLIGAIPYRKKKDPAVVAAEKQAKAETKAAKGKSASGRGQTPAATSSANGAGEALAS